MNKFLFDFIAGLWDEGISTGLWRIFYGVLLLAVLWPLLLPVWALFTVFEITEAAGKED